MSLPGDNLAGITPDIFCIHRKKKEKNSRHLDHYKTTYSRTSQPKEKVKRK